MQRLDINLVMFNNGKSRGQQQIIILQRCHDVCIMFVKLLHFFVSKK